MSRSSEQMLLDSVRTLQKSALYSDFKIFCGEKTFNVHKAIVCPRSRYFTTSCRWGERADSKSEITLQDDDPRLVGLMVDYLYQLNYDDSYVPEIPEEAVEEVSVEPIIEEAPAVEPESYAEPEVYPEAEPYAELEEPAAPGEYLAVIPVYEEEPVEDFSQGRSKKLKKHKKKKTSGVAKRKPRLQDQDADLESSPLATNVLLYSLADKYEIDGLKELARSKFVLLAEWQWQTKAFAHAAELICETTHHGDTGLRDIVVETLHNHQELLDYEEIQKLVDSGNGLAWRLLKHVYAIKT